MYSVSVRSKKKKVSTQLNQVKSYYPVNPILRTLDLQRLPHTDYTGIVKTILQI